VRLRRSAKGDDVNDQHHAGCSGHFLDGFWDQHNSSGSSHIFFDALDHDYDDPSEERGL
jgi:hypothetical protein